MLSSEAEFRSGTLNRAVYGPTVGAVAAVQSFFVPEALAANTAYTGTGSGFQLLIFALCVLIACVVLVAMLWSIIYFRKSRSPEAGSPASSLRAEMAWTSIPIFILVAMAIPAAATLLGSGAQEDEGLPVRVTGYQWKWEFDYLDQGVSYSSLRAPLAEDSDPLLAGVALGEAVGGSQAGDQNVPLIVPAGTRIVVQLTSADVNHGWWIPAFGRQQNAIRGYINEFSFRAREPGLYRGECTEFCGPPESCVPIAVRALEPDEFYAWLQGRGAAARGSEGPQEKVYPLDTVLSRGEVLHNRICAGCHQAGGQGLPAVGFPPLAGTQVSKDQHIRIALHGLKGTAMAPFGDLLDDDELAAIVTYQRNAWGNDSGEVVNAADVAAAR